MVVRAPLLAYVRWLTIIFAPLAVATPLAWNLHPFFAGSLLVLASVASQYIYMGLIRNTRQRVLQSLFRRKARSEDKPFVLISRSYGQAREFTTYVPTGIPGLLDTYLALIEALIFDLSYEHPVVVLGDKDLHSNDPAGRALYMCAWPNDYDQNKAMVFNAGTGQFILCQTVSWDQIFVRLARAARFVLVIPALSEGVRREIALLQTENLGSKTVIYMWPEKGAHPYTAISASCQAWEALREPLAEHGLNLPPHRRQGALLRLDDDFAIRSIYEPIPRRNILTPVVAAATDRDLTSLREIVPEIEMYEIAANPERYGPMWGYILDE